MSSIDLKEKLVILALRELVKGNWDKLTVDYMSKKIKVSPEKVLSICSSKNDLLDIWSNNINYEMYKNLSIKELKEVPVKERLLEIMLCRFDVLSDKKKEVDALVNLSKSNIIQTQKSLIRINNAMELVCTIAGVSILGSKGLIKLKTLSIIWLLVFREWHKTGMNNEDLLLSQLDKNLVLAEKIKNIIFK